ncbi:transporter [Flavobacterium sp. MAH-1]|uniref:Transporter n=1 Tax=Flavobacterium agri TaxID=2743471 RepID=A0A7Y8XZW6_9FLAO|nr:transporter [Flavobacterium agri]NUY79364.1 transporter [Flavobacterium agri]NYA69388.1 transporter [Flavobacterium agri]
MKKFLLLLWLPIAVLASEKDSLSINYKQRFANMLDDCDACGCSATGGSMGFVSLLNTNFVGVRYIYQRYSSTDGLYANSPWYTEQFNSVQIWGRIPIFKNAQVSVLLPYHNNSRETETASHTISGVGDLTVIGLYRVYQTTTDSTFLAHTIQLGAGVKAPTGKYDETNNGSINPGFQLGTGSFDYLLLAEHILRRRQFGFQTMLNYIIKTENDQHYRFGNQFNYSVTLFWLREKDDFSFSPQLGVAGEVSESNRQYDQVVAKTSGSVLFGKIGIEAGIKRFSAGAQFLLPISQDLTGGRVDAKYRFGVNLNYSL